jgi:hypothetical protein
MFAYWRGQQAHCRNLSSHGGEYEEDSHLQQVHCVTRGYDVTN